MISQTQHGIFLRTLQKQIPRELTLMVACLLYTSNPLVKMMDEARRDMAESSRRLGMTLDGQLKAAHAKVSQEEEDLKKVFGDF